jgi:hypothetical protein
MSLIFAKNPRTGRFALPVAAQRGATQQFQIAKKHLSSSG